MGEFWKAFTREETDRQYNPTLWTQRLPAEDLLPAHIDLTAERSESYRRKMGDGLRTIGFGSGAKVGEMAGELAGEMDVFHPASLPENAPIVIYIHGGWWQWFSKEQFSFLAEPFNRHGYAVYMPGYRMAQDWGNETPMESIVQQMEFASAAILDIAARRGARAVYLIGHSAGGQLVALLRETDWAKYELDETARSLLKGVFSLAGLFDIRPLVDSFVNDEIGMTLASAETVSPYLREPLPGARPCPLHLVVPEHDTPEFFRQTKEYQDKLLKAGQTCRFHIANDRDHLDIIENLVHEGDPVMTYMLGHMSPA